MEGTIGCWHVSSLDREVFLSEVRSTEKGGVACIQKGVVDCLACSRCSHDDMVAISLELSLSLSLSLYLLLLTEGGLNWRAEH